MPRKPPVVLLLALALACLVSTALFSQSVKGRPRKGAAPPPVSYRGIIPGVTSAEELRAKLGAPLFEAPWYAWKMLYRATPNEYWLGGPSEELVPYIHLPHPLVTLRGLRKSAASPHVAGVKEYYGLLPHKEDPNLRMTGLFLEHPGINENEALRQLAAPYGKSDPAHSLSAAYVRGVPWHTPSWVSTRRAVYMKADHSEPDAWLLEDIQLRCELAAERLGAALQHALEFQDRIPLALFQVPWQVSRFSSPMASASMPGRFIGVRAPWWWLHRVLRCWHKLTPRPYPPTECSQTVSLFVKQIA
jgi:hypothetical protein